MAELIGIVASVAGLAGVAATVSVTLIECSNNVTNAKSELDSLATEVRDLSTVLEYLGDTLEQAEVLISKTAVQTLERLIGRCEKLLEELKVAAELVRSKSSRLIWLFRKPRVLEHKLNLEGFKSTLLLMMQTITMARTLQQDSTKIGGSGKHDASTSAKRNIQLLRSATLTRKGVLERLNSTARERAQDTDLSAEEKKARDEFNKDTSKSEPKEQTASANGQSTSIPQTAPSYEIGVASFMESMTWEKVLLNSFKALSEEPPAYETLASAVPQTVKPKRSKLLPGSNKSSSDATNEEIRLLLDEWTNIPKAEIDEQLRFQDFISLPGVPQWVQDDYEFQGGDVNNPAHWIPKTDRSKDAGQTKILPHSRSAYEPIEEGRPTLSELLASEGGSWVWRYDNGYTRDYFVGEKKVVQYFVKSLEAIQAETSLAVDRTIVGKQWISKDVLENSGLDYKSYGEGSWAIQGKMKPAEVTALHITASERTEELLRQHGMPGSKRSGAPPKPTNVPADVMKAEALVDFPGGKTGDLRFRKGDILTILTRTSKNEMWWAAELNGKTGMVPANYVRILDQKRTADSKETPPGAEADKPNGSDNKDVAKASLFDAWKAKIESWRKKSKTAEKS